MVKLPGTRIARATAIALATCVLSVAAGAQSYPTKPIRLITPVTPGGTTDGTARVLAQKMSAVLGQMMVVDNRGGAGGTIATEYAARAAPDGYTLLLASAGTFVTASLLYRNLTYNIEKDFAAVSQIAVQPLVMLVHPSVPASSVKEFIAYAKARPGKLNYSSPGTATSSHLAGLLFNRLVEIDTVHVAYKGAAPALTGLVMGEVQYQFSSAVTAKAQIDTGRVKALAVAGDKRSTALPEVRTFEESGLRYTAQTWTGVVVPAGTSPAIIKRLYGAIRETMDSKEVQDQFAKFDTRAVVSTPAEFSALISSERKLWAATIEKFNLRQ